MTADALMEQAGMDALAELAAQVPAHQAIVEVGTYQAANLVNMALAAKAGHGAVCHGVDPYGTGDIYHGRPHMLDRYTHADHDAAIAHIRANNVVRRCRIHIGTSIDVAATWDGPDIGLLVIDGEHREHAVRSDLDAWIPHLAPDHTIAFDDYGGSVGAEVKAYVDQLANDGVLTILGGAGTRMAIAKLA